MTETELIEMLDNEQIKQILNSSDEYIIADFNVFNAGAVLSIELANDFPASIFDEYDEMLDGIIIFDRGRIDELIKSTAEIKPKSRITKHSLRLLSQFVNRKGNK